MQSTHTNRLIHESSPYLLQHAHNPVDWYPWGEEALKRAKEEDKPILVSIGYAACHWCHVMERESFEDETTASMMNQYFVNIKIDREERPDLDHIYMDAVQSITGSGGWPLNVFLTPEAKPFYGGTYFPPVRAYNRASWKEILEGIHKAYQEKKHEILSQAENLTEHLQSANSFGISLKSNGDQNSAITREQLDLITQNLLQSGDTVWGGFGKAPKFPQTFSIQFLLRQYHFTKNQTALNQALLSIDKMIAGGIHDQLGGGFSRYSTDNEWLAPHFEKMLYDNALLISVIAEAYQITGNPLYAKTIQDCIAFIERELTSDEGGCFSALDADSEGVEGKFYTWSINEIQHLLNEDASVFCKYYQVVEGGNWDHVNILCVRESPENFAKLNGLNLTDFTNLLDRSRNILFDARSKRVRPSLDDKILLGWNALMNTAYSKAYAALGIEAYRDRAKAHMAFLEQKFRLDDGTWHHTYKNDIAKQPAFLDDYAYLIQALIHLQEITGDGTYLLKSRDLTEMLLSHFTEAETGFFYFTHDQQKDVILRKKEVYDGATPSGNGIMASNLLYLSKVFDRKDWEQLTRKLSNTLQESTIKYPGSFGIWASLLQLYCFEVLEIAITGKEFEKNLPAVMKKYIPNKIIQSGETNLSNFPLLADRETAIPVAFYVCKNFTCLRPFYNIVDFLANV
jgi:uncharacterized protein YyaL (SSP411 family)